jgi:hypothetical protein
MLWRDLMIRWLILFLVLCLGCKTDTPSVKQEKRYESIQPNKTVQLTGEWLTKKLRVYTVNIDGVNYVIVKSGIGENQTMGICPKVTKSNTVSGANYE